MIKFIKKHLLGGYAIPLFGYYLHIPKAMPVMLVIMLMMLFSELYHYPILMIGAFILLIPVIISFFLTQK